MEVVILTGMSGAGKTIAANYLEDMGYFCVDNAPLQMVRSMLKSFIQWESEGGVSVNKIVFVVDVRSVSVFSGAATEFEEIEKMGVPFRIIYLEASDQVLVNRYKQSRRNHPLAIEKGILKGIEAERELMSPIKNLTQDVIDTTNIEQLELKDILFRMLSKDTQTGQMTILVQSFGFKYGVPTDCDNVFDVRFIPNPFYVQKLKEYSGLDSEVRDYVMSFPETHEFMNKINELIIFAIPYYVREGKVRLNIGVGCTGGRHRSVALAEELAKFLKNNGLHVSIDHRDLENDQIAQVKRKKKM